MAPCSPSSPLFAGASDRNEGYFSAYWHAERDLLSNPDKMQCAMVDHLPSTAQTRAPSLKLVFERCSSDCRSDEETEKWLDGKSLATLTLNGEVLKERAQDSDFIRKNSQFEWYSFGAAYQSQI